MFRAFVLAITAVVLSFPAVAQEAKPALEAALKAMRAERLGTIRYVGTGTVFAFGQAHNPASPWPKFNLKSYDRIIDFDAQVSSQKVVRTQGEDPPRGGGQQPIVGERTESTTVGIHQPWTQQFEIWVTPLGFLKGALANKATLSAKTVGGKQYKVISFSTDEKHTLSGYINQENQLEKVETSVENPVLGDMPVEASFSDYKDFNGITFPAKIVEKQGGFPVYDLIIASVTRNVIAGIVPPALPPSDVGVIVDEQLIAPDVYYFTGGSHHSVIVGFNDYTVVIEAPLDEQRSEAVISEAKKLFFNKPIRYVINTHAHFDHAGGLRAYVAEGATIVTHQENKAYYEKVLALPRTLAPDKLAHSQNKLVLEGVTDKRVLTDGTHEIDLYHVEKSGHSGSMLIAYLPKDKVLVEADLYTTPDAPSGGAEAPINPYTVSLVENLERLKLDPERIIGLHGREATRDELFRAAGRAVESEKSSK